MAKHVEESENTGGVEDKLIQHIGVVKGEKYDIRVDIRQYGDAPPSLRVNRVGEKKKGAFVGPLGSIKSGNEARNLSAMLLQAAEALDEALAKAAAP